MSRAAASEARRAALLALGKRIFAEQPYDQVSTEQIATEAGVSTGLLYHYFENKKGFYVATVRAATDELLAAVSFLPGRPLAESALGALDQFVAFAEANAALYQGVMRGSGADPRVQAVVEEVRLTLTARLLAAASVAATPRLRLQLYGWLGFVEFATLRWLRHPDVDRTELLTLCLGAAPPSLLEKSP